MTEPGAKAVYRFSKEHTDGSSAMRDLLGGKGANLADSLRFLAGAGGFNLVADENLGGPVTVDLHGVDPYDALVVIAESQGLEVDYSRGIVRVGAAKPASQRAD